MKIYLAARYSRHPEMRAIRDILVKMGHVVTSRWIDQHGGDLLESIVQTKLNNEPLECSHYAYADITDLKAADTVVSFTSREGGGKGGRHVEFGIAIGLSKRLVIVGPREIVFHTISRVEWFPDVDRWLSEWGRGWPELLARLV